MPERSHVVRTSLHTRERSYSLGPNALHWKEDEGEGQIEYADIHQMRLVSYLYYNYMHRQCTLHVRSGGKTCIRSHHYESLGKFDDRTETYVPLVRELARRIASSNPQAHFLAGGTGLWFIWLVVLLLCVLALIFLVLVILEGTSLPRGAYSILFLIIIFGPLAWHMMGRNKQSAFDPANIPADLLGG